MVDLFEKLRMEGGRWPSILIYLTIIFSFPSWKAKSGRA